MEQEVLVVGAGPTGLTTAIELTRLGVKASIIDQRPGISALARAVGITPASLEILKPSGATDMLLRQGIRLESIRIQTDSIVLPVAFSQSRNRSPYKYLISLPQEQTETVLCDVLARLDIHVRYNTALISLKDSREGVLATCDDGTTGYYRYVVGADGVQSTTRENIGLTFNGVDLEEIWSVADLETSDWPHNNTFTLSLLNQGKMAAIVPLNKNRIRVVANTENALETIPNDLHITNTNRRGTFKISVRQVNTYQRGNIFLAGDAAHCHSPVGGRGMNLGIADAACIAKCIASDNITAYSGERHPAGSRTLSNSERARKLLSSQKPLVRGAVASSLKLTAKSTLLQRRLIDQLLYA